MEKRIYKYRLQVSARTIELSLPKDARILSVGVQEGHCHIWALVDAEAPKETRLFRTIATGEAFTPDGLTYIGTFHDVESWMVFHLFEEGAKA